LVIESVGVTGARVSVSLGGQDGLVCYSLGSSGPAEAVVFGMVRRL